MFKAIQQSNVNNSKMIIINISSLLSLVCSNISVGSWARAKGRCIDVFPRTLLSRLCNLESFPMDTSLSMRHRFDIEIQRGKFVEITLILKGESTWKLWHRFEVDISTWIRLSKSTKYRWVLHVDFSMSFRRQIDVTSVLAVSILSFSNIFCSGNLF